MNRWAKRVLFFSSMLMVSQGAKAAIIVSTASNSYVNVPATTNLDLTSFGTFAVWFTPTFTADGVTVALVGGKGNYYGDRNGYGLYYYFSTGWVAEIASASAANQALGGLTPTYFTANVPVHLALVWSGSTVKLYINGDQKSSVAQTVNATPATLPFRIGANANTVADAFGSGTIEEVVVSSRAFSASEIKNMALSREHYIYSDGLIGYWPLDDCTFNATTGIVVDRSLNRNSGTLTSSPKCVGSKILRYP